MSEFTTINSIDYLHSKEAANVTAGTIISVDHATLMSMEERDFRRMDYIQQKIKRKREQNKTLSGV